MFSIYKEILNIYENGKKAALATIISNKSHTPRHVGTKMLIKSNGDTVGTIGGGNIEHNVCKEAEEVIRKNKAKIISFDLTGKPDSGIDMICGGIMEIFLEPIFSAPVVFIFGGGHVSLALYKIAKTVGFSVVIIDDREKYTKKERFPEADEVIFSEYKDVFSKININESSYIVIVTEEHRHDEFVLEKVINLNYAYLGMMASPKKRDTIFSNLEKHGIKKEIFDKVCSPIGIDINSETPEEIAVSIVAEMIKKMRS